MRIVAFTDANTVVTGRLIRATGEHRLVGIVTTRPERFRFSPMEIVQASVRKGLIALTNPEITVESLHDLRIDLFRWAERRRIPILVPPEGDPNAPDFVESLATRLRPELALSFYCRHRFGRRLRAIFSRAVNCHDGLLPDYRGVMATSFSIYAGERESGIAFHEMTGKIDAGPVLHQEAVPIDERSTLDEVSREKSYRAAAALPRVVARIEAGERGTPQRGEGRYYSAHDAAAMTRLSDPSNEVAERIRRRIRAFGAVELTIGDQAYPVTRLRRARPGERRAFRTADGRWLKPDRFRGLPELLDRIVR